MKFPLPTVSTMDYPQQTAGSVTVCFLWWDWDGRRDAASSVQPAATFPWKLQTAGTYPVSVWPGCCLAHDLFHPHKHIHRHSMCAHTHTHTHCARRGYLPVWWADPDWLCWSSECNAQLTPLEASALYSQSAIMKTHIHVQCIWVWHVFSVRNL